MHKLWGGLNGSKIGVRYEHAQVGRGSLVVVFER